MTEKKDERGFYQRLIDAMKEMENPTKSKQGYNYKYETLEQLLGIIRPALAKNNLMLTQRQTVMPGVEGWCLETVVFDDAGEKLIMDSRHMPIAKDAQAQGSWETYLRRYALRTAFGLTGEDDDGAATLPKNSGVMNGAKITEMASDKQMNMIHAKLSELADLRRVSKDEAEAALIASKTMKGADLDNLTKQQASDAITLLITWIDKASNYDELDVYGTSSFEGGQDKA